MWREQGRELSVVSVCVCGKEIPETGSTSNSNSDSDITTTQDEDFFSDEILFSDDGEEVGEANDGGLFVEMESKVINATESSLTVFEGFITDQWLSGNDNKALEVLELQFKYAGGFCTEMQRLDLSTPPRVRLDLDKTLGLLRNKTDKRGITKLEKFVLPNMEILESGDILRKVCEDYCGALCGTTVTAIDQLWLHCDQISENFVAGDLQWIKELRGRYQMNQINVSYLNIVLINLWSLFIVVQTK